MNPAGQLDPCGPWRERAWRCLGRVWFLFDAGRAAEDFDDHPEVTVGGEVCCHTGCYLGGHMMYDNKQARHQLKKTTVAAFLQSAV